MLTKADNLNGHLWRGRIAGIADHLPANGEPVRDCNGATLMPGFIDTHGHFLINVLASQVFVDVSCAPSGKATIYRDAEGNP